ncbi:UPF0729 protein AAEL015238-like isoform X2 [Pollicipes pollicipes]|nr:UPF0729 protein AAEL015238-like isoform X2 [Pollicipes pollicipes]
MVCISCIVVPVVLYLWHRFLQPLMLRFWNPWGAVEPSAAGPAPAADGLKCPFSSRSEAAGGCATDAHGQKEAAQPAANGTHVKGD